MILLGLHMPKCGGTTLLQRAMSLLPHNAVYQCTHFVRNFRENRMEFAHLHNHAQLRLIFGHQLHEEMMKYVAGPIGLFTGLREPRARLKSHLIFLRRLRKHQGLPPLDVEAEVARRSNGMCRFLISHFPSFSDEGTEAERALRVLEHFWCIYFIDRFEETVAPVFEQLGIDPQRINWNVGEVSQENDEYARDIDVSEAQLDQDMILYETARKRYSIQRAVSAEAENRLALFREEPLRPKLLRKFLHAVSYQQFQDANVLEQVIAHRRQMICELEAELGQYAKISSRRRAQATNTPAEDSTLHQSE